MSQFVDDMSLLSEQSDLAYSKSQSKFLVQNFERVHSAAERLLAFAQKTYTMHKPIMEGGELFDFMLDLVNDETIKRKDYNANRGSEVKLQVLKNAEQLTRTFQHLLD